MTTFKYENESSVPKTSNSSIEALVGLPIDLGADNIVQEVADGLRYINVLINAYYEEAGDEDIMSYHDYVKSQKKESKGAPFWPIFAKNLCDFTCIERNFKFSGDQSGGGWDFQTSGVSINIPRKNVIEKLGGKISHIAFREQEVLRSKTTSGIRYSILLHVYPDDLRIKQPFANEKRTVVSIH